MQRIGWSLLVGLLAVAFAACNDDTELQPRDRPDGGAGPDAPVSTEPAEKIDDLLEPVRASSELPTLARAPAAVDASPCEPSPPNPTTSSASSPPSVAPAIRLYVADTLLWPLTPLALSGT